MVVRRAVSRAVRPSARAAGLVGGGAAAGQMRHNAFVWPSELKRRIEHWTHEREQQELERTTVVDGVRYAEHPQLSTRYVGPEEAAAEDTAAAKAEAETTAAAAEPGTRDPGAVAAEEAAAMAETAAASTAGQDVGTYETEVAAHEPVTATTEVLYDGPANPLVSAEPEDDVDIPDDDPKHIARRKVSYTNPEEEFMIAVQRHVHENAQKGPFIGSRNAEETGVTLASRTRREIDRLPHVPPPWEGAETSFRRLPRDVRLPDENQLRAMYPMKTSLQLVWEYADCVDYNGLDPLEEPCPVKYTALLPEGYDPAREYPCMVVLSDHRGMEQDFEDFCVHFFERPSFAEGMREQQWIVLSPCINMRHSQVYAIEGVIAKFCDWATTHYRCEHNKVHLVGKGLGGYAALRTVLEYKEVALSCVALLGRMAAPFRPLERPMDKVRNAMGTHTLMYVPGLLRKVDWVYKFKSMMDNGAVRPACRAVHFADVRDHQLYYALNPVEFWNYMLYFRRHNLHGSIMSDAGHVMGSRHVP